MQTIQHWIKNLGLWPRMALGISLGFLILFAVFSALGERALRDSTDRILKERLIVAQMAASQLDVLLSQIISDLELTRQFTEFDPRSSDLSAEDRILTHTYNRLDEFMAGILFLDADGRVVLSQPAELYPSGVDMSGSLHAVQSPPPHEAFVSKPFRDVFSGWPVVAVTIPVYQDERYLGLLSGLINLDKPAIKSLLEHAASLSESGHALLVDEQGRTLAATFPIPFLAPGEHVSLYRRVVRQGQATVDVAPVEMDRPNAVFGHAHEHMMAIAPLHQVPWAVAVGEDVTTTFAGQRRLRIDLALLGIVTLMATWMITLIGVRRLVRPVQRLTGAAQRIAAGDLQTPLQVTEGGEIGDMAVALERMRSQLLINIRELASLNETLETRVAERTDDLQKQQALTQQLLRRIITAQEEERARLSQELHDEIGQTLTAVQISLDRLARALPDEDTIARERAERARTLAEQALGDLRRVISALRPGVLDRLGLAPALGWMADHIVRPLGMAVEIETINLQERLPSEIETILFRIAQEAMNNIVRHSEATHLTLKLAQTDGQAFMTVQDNGRGFDPSTITIVPGGNRGLGLAGMRERASLAGGHVTVNSAPGQGTLVQVVVPVPSVADQQQTGPETKREK